MNVLLKRVVQRVILLVSSFILQIGVISFFLLKYSESFFDFYLASLTLSIIIVFIIINNKSNPSYKIAWIVPVMIFPIFGGLFYLLYGGNKLSTREKLKMVIQNIERERGDDAGSGAGHGHPFGRAAGQRAGRFVLPFLRADIAVVAQQRLAEQVIDVCVVGDVGRTVVHVRHDVRGKGRDLERGELAEQQYGQQDRKDPCYVFVGCHCKKPPVCGL